MKFRVTMNYVVSLLGLVARRFAGRCGIRTAKWGVNLRKVPLGVLRFEARDSGSVGWFVFDAFYRFDYIVGQTVRYPDGRTNYYIYCSNSFCFRILGRYDILTFIIPVFQWTWIFAVLPALFRVCSVVNWMNDVL